MPVSFLSPAQRDSYGQYLGDPSTQELARYFLDDPTAVPPAVLATMSRQLGIDTTTDLTGYRDGKWRFAHAAQIRTEHGYRDLADRAAGFSLTRWLYAQCWTGTERPSALFDRATTWMLAHKVLLPGATTLERFVAKLRHRVDVRVWRVLASGISPPQQRRLEDLLRVPDEGRSSSLVTLRTGAAMVSGPALVRALERLNAVRSLSITVPAAAAIAPTRIAALARFAEKAKVTAVARLPALRRAATLVAFVHSLEASAQDDALEVLDRLLRDIFGAAEKADRKARLRSLKDLDALALTLAHACAALLDPALPDNVLRDHVFARVPRATLAEALGTLSTLVRPPDDVFYTELQTRYRRVRLFLPTLLHQVHFEAAPAGAAVVAALEYLKRREAPARAQDVAPSAVVTTAWRRYVYGANDAVDHRAYTFCVLDQLREALRRRDVFVTPSWRYADPRRNLLAGAEWEAARPIMCRTLGYSPRPEPILAALSDELDQTYRAVAARLPNNPAVRFERIDGKDELIVSPLDKVEEPAALVALRTAIAGRLPRVDLPEILLEIAARTDFAVAFTHVSERAPRRGANRDPLGAPGAVVRWPPPTACASWCRCAPCTRGPTPSTSVSAGASPTTTSCPISSPACTALRSRGRCATAWCCSRSRSNSRQSCSPRRS